MAEAPPDENRRNAPGNNRLPNDQPSQEQTETERGRTADPPAEDDGDWIADALCSDDECMGVIGEDGRCQECGKPSKEG